MPFNTHSAPHLALLDHMRFRLFEDALPVTSSPSES